MSVGSSFVGAPAQQATCRSCGAAIVWASTVKGKATPLDAVPVTDGEWQIDRGVAVRADMFAMARYRAHWATCPNASEHRRKT